jgi:hypothetical protein
MRPRYVESALAGVTAGQCRKAVCCQFESPPAHLGRPERGAEDYRVRLGVPAIVVMPARPGICQEELRIRKSDTFEKPPSPLPCTAGREELVQRDAVAAIRLTRK